MSPGHAEVLDLRRQVAELRAKLAAAEQRLGQAFKRETQEWLKSPAFQTFVELKHGIVGDVLSALQDGEISRGRAAEALAEIAHGAKVVRLPEHQGDAFAEDELPAEVVRELRERAAQLERELAGAREDSGAGLIASERRRQVSEEGWTPEHDDEHGLSELSRAAIVYAKLASLQACNPDSRISPEPLGWPWKFCWWKPSADPIRNLVKAGALIAAEIDRLRRRAAIDAAKEGRKDAE